MQNQLGWFKNFISEILSKIRPHPILILGDMPETLELPETVILC
jgi:hypothetical protein